MSLKDILQRNPNLTLKDLQELQAEYNQRFMDSRFSGQALLSHGYSHLGKLLGRLAAYVEEMQHGEQPSTAEIREKVIPDMIVFSSWFAEVLGVNMEQAYLERFVGNLRRLYADKIPPQELEELEAYVQQRFSSSSS